MSEPNPFRHRLGPGPMPLRALTLHAAWATMVVNGDKTIEVRSRPLKYRGLLLIHAAQDRPSVPGAFVGVVDLYDCRPLTADDQWATCLSKMPAGRAWGLHLRDALRLPGRMRIEWRGRQGLWKPERPGGDPGELREVLADAFGPWGRGVAAAAERAELRLIWRLGTWRVHPPGDPDSRLRYGFTVSTPSTPSGSIGVNRTLEVHGSKHDGGRAHREFCKEKGLLIGKMGDRWPAAIKARRTTGVMEAERQVRAEAADLGMKVEREPGRGWTLREADGSRETLPNLGDVSERLYEIKMTRETKLRVTKREVTEAAVQVGLRFPQEKTPEGEWVLEDAAGETVRTDRSLASLLQHCRDHKDTLRRETADAALAVGLHLKMPEPEHEGAGGLWLLVDAAGKTVQSEWTLPPLLQHCRDRQTAAAEATWGYRGAERLCEVAERAGAADQPEPETTPETEPETAGPPAASLHPRHEEICAAEATWGAREADRLYGGELPYDRERVTAEVAHYLGQGALSILAAGQRLIQLKEHEPHGEWLGLLERIGIGRATAGNMMRAARKFLDGPNSELVCNLKSPTALYELALMDDEDLAELREGGTIAGATLEDIQRMTPTELRETLRRERQERREREKAQRDRSKNKDDRIRNLEGQTDDLHRRLRDARTPGRKTWSEDEMDLLTECARTGMELEAAFSNCQAVIWRLQKLAEQEDGRAQELNTAPAGEKLLHVRAQLDAIASSARRAVDAMDEQLSDHLATERQPPTTSSPGTVP